MRNRTATSVALVVGMAGVLPGCTTGPALPRVAVIGDSITALAQPDISAALDPSYQVNYTFRIGVRIDQMLDLVASDLQTNGPTWAVIVNLGSNDAITGGGSARALDSFRGLLVTTGSAQCEVLTTISSGLDVRGGSDIAASLNRKIFDLAAARPDHYKVVDWNGFLHSLDRTQLGRYLQHDLTHETPVGSRWIAESDAAALQVCGSRKLAPVIGASGS